MNAHRHILFKFSIMSKGRLGGRVNDTRLRASEFVGTLFGAIGPQTKLTHIRGQVGFGHKRRWYGMINILGMILVDAIIYLVLGGSGAAIDAICTTTAATAIIILEGIPIDLCHFGTGAYVLLTFSIVSVTKTTHGS
jgi:hypothetical protein